MATEIILPRLGQGMESGTVVKWLKSEGDAVRKGEPLYELDTDKVTQEVEADAGGVLLKIAVAEGSEMPVGTVLAFVGTPGEEVPALPSPDGDGSASTASRVEALERGVTLAEEAAPARVSSVQPAEGRLKASPLARRIARERGVDLASVTATGPEGRVVAEDVERTAAALARFPAAAPVGAERVPLTSIRRTIARRLTEAWQIPVFQLVVSADMERANGLLERLRELDPESHHTVTDLLTKACATALVRHREVNVSFGEDELTVHPSANVGIAVAAPQGLYVPVIREAERKSLAEIAAARRDLVERTRAGKATQADLEGGTFTISNLGMFDIEQFTAVLNPPQAAILAVGATEERAVVRGGELVARPVVTLTGTFDHRAVDGAPAAAFLDTVKAVLEEPGLAL